MKSDDPPIVVRQTIGASRPAVWAALTVAEQMRQWYFETIPAFEPEVGFEVQFEVQSNERTFVHDWTVTEVRPPERIAYRWRYDGYAGNSVVEFDLSDGDGGTEVVLTHRVTETFPQDVPEFRREACRQGWIYFIEGRLKEWLEGQGGDSSGG